MLCTYNVYRLLTCVLAQAKQDIDVLYSRYYPIEVNATLTEAEKTPHMETWWRAVRAHCYYQPHACNHMHIPIPTPSPLLCLALA